MFAYIFLFFLSLSSFAATNGCPSGWVQSADNTTCVQTIINNTIVNSTNDTSRPICITGYTYNSSVNKCQKTTPYNSQTTNKTYTFVNNLSFGKDPYENDMCLNISGIQYAVPANATASSGNCSCDSGYVYNGLTDSNAACLLKTNGACGASNGQSLVSAPVVGLCSSGIQSGVSGSGPWSWSCSGSNGGTNVSCSATKIAPISGVCGSSSGQALLSTPSSGLCSSGTQSSVSGSGPWTWSCSGSNGGSISYCTATKTNPVNGGCGLSNGKVLSAAPSSGLCNVGVQSTVTGAGPWNWSCSGSNGGTNASCSATKIVPVSGVCGSSSGQALLSIPSSGLCSSGTQSSVSGSGPWAWSCAGSSGGADASCSATKAVPVSGVCGASNGKTFATIPSSGFCNSGTQSSVSGSGPWTWSCAGAYGGSSASCSATKGVLVNGSCGTSNGQSLASAPSSGLCNTGTATSVSGSGPWSWSCSGAYGGSSISCSAAKLNPNIGKNIICTYYMPFTNPYGGSSVSQNTTGCHLINGSATKACTYKPYNFGLYPAMQDTIRKDVISGSSDVCTITYDPGKSVYNTWGGTFIF
jgi:hypothetical protein